jgi:hypothetical protein
LFELSRVYKLCRKNPAKKDLWGVGRLDFEKKV